MTVTMTRTKMLKHGRQPKKNKIIIMEEWMRMDDCDMCAINETGLNGDSYRDV